MSVRDDDLKVWTAEQLLAEYETRIKTLNMLVGDLYKGIVQDEMQRIADACTARFGCHPNWLRDEGIVPSTWTDSAGVVHRWKSPSPCEYGKPRTPDRPVKEITCLQCVACAD